MEDPMNVSLIDQVQLFTNYAIEVHLSSPDEVEEAINKVYKKDESAALFTEFKEMKEEGKSLSETTSIVKIVDLIITQAVRDRASDIHVEPEGEMLRLRFVLMVLCTRYPLP